MDFPRTCPARWLSDQSFGMCIPQHDFLYPFYDLHSNYYRQWSNQSSSKEYSSTLENEESNYKITLDVQHFRPEEINVKVSDTEIIVEGKHEERPDPHGYITRQFKRRYLLPSNCPSDNVTSTLSSDGILTIIAMKTSSSRVVEKIIPIKMCGTSLRNRIETQIISEETQSQKEKFKETEDIKSKNQIMLREDHSRLLLKPELLKQTTSDSNGTFSEKATTKETIDVMKTSVISDPLNISSTTSKIEESIGKSILGLTALTEQLGHSSASTTSAMCGTKAASEKLDIKSTASESCSMKTGSETCGVKSAMETSEMKATSSGIKNVAEGCGMKTAAASCDMKTMTEACGMKSTSEKCGMKSASETCGIKSTAETSDMKASSGASASKTTAESGIKAASESCNMKGASASSGMQAASGSSGMKSTSESSSMQSSEMSGIKGISKMTIQESSSSYSSSSMSTSTTARVSGKAGESVSDIISAELRDAAENF